MLVHYTNALALPPAERPTFLMDDGIQGFVVSETDILDNFEAHMHLDGHVNLAAAVTISHFGALNVHQQPIDKKPVLNISKIVSLNSARTPFHIAIPQSSSLPSTVKSASMNMNAEVDLGPVSSSYMTASVDYTLEITVYRRGREQQKFTQDVILVNPALPTDPEQEEAVKQSLTTLAPLKQKLTTIGTKSRRDPSRSKNITIEVTNLPQAIVCPFGAEYMTTTVQLKFGYIRDQGSTSIPPPFKFAITSFLDSSTTINLLDASADGRVSSVALQRSVAKRVQIVPSNVWRNAPDGDCSSLLWSYNATLPISEPNFPVLTPSFHTPYISHCYNLRLHIQLTEDGLFKGRKAEADLTLPVTVLYEKNALPLYTATCSPPAYISSSC